MAVCMVRRGTVQLGSLGRAGRKVCVRTLSVPAEYRGGLDMTLAELSLEYRAHASTLDLRIRQLQHLLEKTEDLELKCQLQDRIRMLSVMLREARELAVLTERYYDRGYHRNAKYTV